MNFQGFVMRDEKEKGTFFFFRVTRHALQVTYYFFPRLGHLVIGIWCLFVIWCLGFGASVFQVHLHVTRHALRVTEVCASCQST